MRRFAWLAGCSLAWSCAVALWWLHPYRLEHVIGWCVLAAMGCALACGAVYRPWGAVACLLALLPVMDDSVQTGWRHVALLDLGICGVIGGLWWRRARVPGVSLWHRPPMLWCVAAAGWGLCTCMAWWRAPVPAWGALTGVLWGDAGNWAAPWSALKPSLQAAMLWAALWPERDADKGQRALSWGLLAGLAMCVVVLMVERHRMVGLMNFNEIYRTVGPFVEMNLGGGALDAYLAITLPFAWWGWAQSRAILGKLAMALLLVLAIYGVVTTYSRGVILTSVVTSAVAVWALARAPRPRTASRWVNRGLIALLALEFMALILFAQAASERFRQSQLDASSRLEHWEAIARLGEGWGARLWGIGLGQLPVRHALEVPGGEWPGRWTWHEATSLQPEMVRWQGPIKRPELAGRLPLAQVWRHGNELPATLRLRWRTERPVAVRLQLCEQHLLYQGLCLTRQLVLPGGGGWQTATWPWSSANPDDRLRLNAWRQSNSPRKFSMSMFCVACEVSLAEVELLDGRGAGLLLNPRFEAGLTHWLPIALAYFLPWHADNLYLEIATERGGIALGCWLVLALLALRHAWRASAVSPWSWGVLGLLTVGAVISVLEFPRVSFLAQFLLLASSSLGGERGRASS